MTGGILPPEITRRLDQIREDLVELLSVEGATDSAAKERIYGIIEGAAEALGLAIRLNELEGRALRGGGDETDS